LRNPETAPRPITFVLAVVLATVSHGATSEAGEQNVDNDVTVQLNLNYRDTQSPHCTLDIAFPKKHGMRARPAIIVIHGGGWIEGDKSSFVTATHRNPANIRDYAKLGFVAATINYRLSREAAYPAALDDCRCAIRWLRAHAAEFHVDPQRIGAYGNSAGGHLALLLGMMPAAGVKAGDPYPSQSSEVQAVASDSGPIDLLAQDRSGLLRSVIETFMGGPPDRVREALYRQASPISYIAKSGPPLLLLYGEIDNQVDVRITDEFVAALSRAGRKDITYVRLANIGHCPHSLIRVPFVRQVVDDFFLRTLGPP
jgi:acetyl esterase/lipase